MEVPLLLPSYHMIYFSTYLPTYLPCYLPTYLPTYFLPPSLPRPFPSSLSSAYGTLALSHPPDDPNGDGSSAFFLKADAAYTPAGLNTLDGAYSVIGYVVDGAQALDDLAEGDAIESVRMLSGQQYLK